MEEPNGLLFCDLSYVAKVKYANPPTFLIFSEIKLPLQENLQEIFLARKNLQYGLKVRIISNFLWIVLYLTSLIHGPATGTSWVLIITRFKTLLARSWKPAITCNIANSHYGLELGLHLKQMEPAISTVDSKYRPTVPMVADPQPVLAKPRTPEYPLVGLITTN